MMYSRASHCCAHWISSETKTSISWFSSKASMSRVYTWNSISYISRCALVNSRINGIGGGCSRGTRARHCCGERDSGYSKACEKAENVHGFVSSEIKWDTMLLT